MEICFFHWSLEKLDVGDLGAGSTRWCCSEVENRWTVAVVILAQAVAPRREVYDSGTPFFDREMDLRPLLESKGGIPQPYWQIACGLKHVGCSAIEKAVSDIQLEWWNPHAPNFSPCSLEFLWRR